MWKSENYSKYLAFYGNLNFGLQTLCNGNREMFVFRLCEALPPPPPMFVFRLCEAPPCFADVLGIGADDWHDDLAFILEMCMWSSFQNQETSSFLRAYILFIATVSRTPITINTWMSFFLASQDKTRREKACRRIALSKQDKMGAPRFENYSISLKHDTNRNIFVGTSHITLLCSVIAILVYQRRSDKRDSLVYPITVHPIKHALILLWFMLFWSQNHFFT